MKIWFKENTTGLCGCNCSKNEDEIYCRDCANFWQSTLSKDMLPFANENCKVKWMNDTINCWLGLMKDKIENISQTGD